MNYFIPRSRPSLFLLPLLVVGMPVALAIFCLALETPNALFKLKDSPGIVDFLAMTYTSNLIPL
jgi:hypothetical protein